MALAACTTPFKADVSRFQSQLPAPAGQTFAIVADDPKLSGGLEFSQYASIVRDRMAKVGYVPVQAPASACSKARPKRVPPPIACSIWCPTWSKRCSRISPGTRARPCALQSRRRRSDRFFLKSD